MYKIILPIFMLIGAVFFGKYLLATGPEAKKRPFVQKLPVVEVMPLKAQAYTVHIEASGVVSAGTTSNLIAEVSGRIIRISDNFNEGGYFDEGEILLEIDQSNYINAVEIAKSDIEANQASLLQLHAEQKSNQRSIQLAKQNLAIGNKELTRVRSLFKSRTLSRSAVDTEEQRVNQLKQNLQNIQGAQSTFSSRKNVLKARIKSSEARLNQEILKLTRTTIKAPYAGRILKKNVNSGQFVSVGSVLAETYATDFVNVELPLSLNQYELLGMPESFRNKQIQNQNLPSVSLTNPDSSRSDSWKGLVVRTGAALDPQSRQIKVIVRVDNPYEASPGVKSPLRIGQYLNAKIKGLTFNDVYVLPSVSVIYNREIRILKDGKIAIIPVEVLWNASEATVVKPKVNIEGEQLILTNLTQAVNGMPVITVEDQKENMLKKNNNNIKGSNRKLYNKKHDVSKSTHTKVQKDTHSNDALQRSSKEKSSNKKIESD